MRGTRIASDIHQDLILLWQGIQDGSYDPPLHVTEEEYKSLRHAPPSAHRGFCGFGLGFSGSFFGGYSRTAKQRKDGDLEKQAWTENYYCVQARRSLLAARPKIQGVTFLNCSYDEHDPHDYEIYADPPYFQTTKYRGTDPFDHVKFWSTIREWSQDNLVVVSEYTAPEDFVPVIVLSTKTSLRVRDPSSSKLLADPRMERLFTYRYSPFYDHIRGILLEGALLLPPSTPAPQAETLSAGLARR